MAMKKTGIVIGRMPLIVALLSSALPQAALSQINAKQPLAASDTAPDPKFAQPYIDKDEWRDAPVRHRYVHGGFQGTDARFAFYFPPKDSYSGRFFQHVTPTPESEDLDTREDGSLNHMKLSMASGAYFVQTNEGGLAAIRGDQTIIGYRINAAAAVYSRVVAQQMYGTGRPYGYAFGGSGGCFKTLSGFENTTVWDGVVPFVCGSPMSIPNMFTVRVLALRLLHDKFASIVDGAEPGGGDMYRDLDPEEKATLREITQFGFPPAAWFNYKTIGEGAFPVLFPLVRLLDPKYFTEFWTLPGYEGYNPEPKLSKARIQLATRVTQIVSSRGATTQSTLGGVDAAKELQSFSSIAFEMQDVPAGSLEGGFVQVKSGASAGKELPIGKVVGKTVYLAANPLGADNTADIMAVKPGDQVQLDNSDFLAVQYYHRHQVPTQDYYTWNQYRGPDGKPLEPQRPMLIGPLVTGAGSIQSGVFKGKMIMVESMMDQDALPWQADWYRAKVEKVLGDKINDSYRLWFVEHAVHSDEARQGDTTHTVSYLPVLYQALRDVSAWAEKGTVPPVSTAYRVDNGQIVVPSTAEERMGVQPVATLSVNGGSRTTVGVHRNVKLIAHIEAAPGGGKILSAELDFDGKGTFPSITPASAANLSHDGKVMTFTMTHTYDKVGTYFVTLRATAQRDDSANTPLTRMQNLGRVRVVVR